MVDYLINIDAKITGAVVLIITLLCDCYMLIRLHKGGREVVDLVFRTTWKKGLSFALSIKIILAIFIAYFFIDEIGFRFKEYAATMVYAILTYSAFFQFRSHK